jgi:uncharacterized protein YjbI with pentapeptide repeats
MVGWMPLTAAGRDLAAVRAALDGLRGLQAATFAARQDVADDICEWLRFALGPGRKLDPEQAQLEDLAYEALAFLAANLQDPSAAGTFCGLDLNLSSIALDRADFSGIYLTNGSVDFRNCSFGPDLSFAGAHFLGAHVVFDGSVFRGSAQRVGGHFSNATFSGSAISFEDAVFRDDTCRFDDSDFASGQISFYRAHIFDSMLSFARCRFRGAIVGFTDGVLQRGELSFTDCSVTDGELRFDRAKLRAATTLDRTAIHGGLVSFDGSEISGPVSFVKVALAGGALTIRNIAVTSHGIDCRHMVIDGGSLTMDGAEALFGDIEMSEVSFLDGAVSLRDIRAPFDGVIYFPWAICTRGRMQVRDDSFDADRPHDFTVTVARYRPGVITDWGSLKP